MAIRKKEELNKYDWIPGREGQMLIYAGRTVSREDGGIMRSNKSGKYPQDVLMVLLKQGNLTGQALTDAQTYAQETQAT